MNEAESKELEKQPPEVENEALDELEFLEDDGEISPELDQFFREQAEEENKELEQEAIEGEPKTDFDDIMDDWEEEDEDLGLDDIEESEDDPLGEYEGGGDSDEQAPNKEPVQHVNERVNSEKNRKNIERLGAKFLDKADLMKATLCSKLSGQHLAEYVADDEMKEILLECIKEYLATKEVTELSPFGALMAALAMWSLPSLGVALLDRFQLKKELKAGKKEKTSTHLNPSTAEELPEEEAEVVGEHQTDYSHLKEYQEERKIFSTNSTGMYNYTAKGTYIKVDLANERPSPEVQTWLDEGLKDRAIKKRLGYGK